MIFWELFECMDHMISKWKWKWSLIKRASQTFSLSPHDNELRDLTSLRRPALSLSLCSKTGFCRTWGHCLKVSSLSSPAAPLSVSASHRQGWRKQAGEMRLGEGGPLELSPRSNSYLHDVNRCNPITVFYSLFFFLFLIQADISRQGLRGVADAQLWLAYMFPLSDTYCRASSRNQCLLNTLLSPLYGLFKASQYRFM